MWRAMRRVLIRSEHGRESAAPAGSRIPTPRNYPRDWVRISTFDIPRDETARFRRDGATVKSLPAGRPVVRPCDTVGPHDDMAVVP